MANLSLLTDHALGEGTDAVLDGLGFGIYARVLAEAAADTPGPFTIGVFGEWGTGKTSLMRLIEAELESHEDVMTVWFNAWRYENEEHPIVPLVGTIIRSLERHKPFLDRLTDSGRSLIRALRAVAYGFSAKSKVKIPGFAEIEASFVAKDMIDRSDCLTLDPLLDRSLYYEAFESLSSAQLPTRSRIVVLIDDLDRCFPDRAIKLLESIKLVLAQPGLIFVLGVARRVIEGYLQHRYQNEYGISDFRGHLYLDKIVQLPFHIPPHVGRIRDFSDKLLERIDSHTGDKLSEILPLIGEASGANPRTMIRFVNNLLIDLAISRQLPFTKEVGEIPVEYFAITRCLQQHWPEVFSVLVNSKRLCSMVSEWDSLEDVREAAASDARPRFSWLATQLRSDTDLYGLLKTEQGRYWLKNHQLRQLAVQFLLTERPEMDQETMGRGWEPHAWALYLVCGARDADAVAEIAKLFPGIPVNTVIVGPPNDWRKEVKIRYMNSAAIGYCFGQDTASEPLITEMNSAHLSGYYSASVVPFVILLPGSRLGQQENESPLCQILDLRESVSREKVAAFVSAHL